jgi:Kef-type K+ transport system membrane component KefB
MKKSKIIPAILAIFSFQIYFGAILGYYLAKNFSKRFRSLIFEIKNWRFHLHHWLVCSLVLISSFFFDFLSLPNFVLGFLGGMIFQGIYCYDDWHKILIKTKRPSD